MHLESIHGLIKEDLEATDQYIVSNLASNVPLVKQIIEYMLTCGGKRIRPMVLLLCARALMHRGRNHVDLAAVIELIHTATLIHDDVVDSSTLRRGHKTVHTIWGSDVSVLVGDYLYSQAFLIIVNLKHQAILDVFARSTPYIAEGEILQLVNCNNPDTTEEFYFEIIKRKTAKLFEISSQFGAALATDSEPELAAMRDYGLNLGLAYQLIDDALDYSQSADETGKNVRQDIAEGKTTLPLIKAMRSSKGKDLEILQNAIKSGSSENLDKILTIIESTDAIKYTADRARFHAQQAKLALSYIPLSPYRNALEDLSDFVVNRTY